EDIDRMKAEKVASAPALRDVLPVASFAYVLKEDHVYHIDYPGRLAAREVRLGCGRRRAAEGRLRGRDDVWMLRRTEVRSALDDGNAVTAFDLDELVAKRRRELAEGRRERPRAYLGDPPADEERHAVLEKFYGPGAMGPAAGAIRGTGASAGTGDGTARVVAGPEAFPQNIAGGVLLRAAITPP